MEVREIRMESNQMTMKDWQKQILDREQPLPEPVLNPIDNHNQNHTRMINMIADWNEELLTYVQEETGELWKYREGHRTTIWVDRKLACYRCEIREYRGCTFNEDGTTDANWLKVFSCKCMTRTDALKLAHLYMKHVATT